MDPATSPTGSLAHSHLFLRRAIGVIGLTLPEVLIIGKLFVDGGAPASSISGYYYTDMRDVFVGSLCAIGVLLLCYRGYGRLDDVAGDITAVAAIAVAVLPTTPADATGPQRTIGTVHFVFATVYFLMLAFFCLHLFRRTDSARPTPRKLTRNRVYLVTGLIILLCLLLIAVNGALLGNALGPRHLALWLESVATVAFGFAWLTKGEAVLGDR